LKKIGSQYNDLTTLDVVVAILYLSGGILFSDMSVHENLEMGAYPYHAWKQKGETLKQVYEIFPKLKEREGQLARTLSGGEKIKC
jgi:ABC-type branched-subunit amino acid transport system ATPase component